MADFVRHNSNSAGFGRSHIDVVESGLPVLPKLTDYDILFLQRRNGAHYVAVLLARSGYRVLVLDWDFEAPGIEHFFQEFIDIDRLRKKIRTVDILTQGGHPFGAAAAPRHVERRFVHITSKAEPCRFRR